MPVFFTYLLKASLSLAVLYVVYRTLLSRLTFHCANRAYLLFAWLFSLLFPLLVLPVQKTSPFEQGLQRMLPFSSAGAGAHSGFAFERLLTVVYLAGTLVMTLRLLLQALSLYRLHRTCEKYHRDGIQYCETGTQIPPFSFWKNIYFNPALHDQESTQKIILHESVHVMGRHSADILLSECMLIFFWFNPAAWLLKKAVQENLEYLTDREVLKKGIDRKAYQYSLLSQGCEINYTSLLPTYFSLILKTRILMMNRVRSASLTVLSYLVVIPLLVLLCYVNSAFSKAPAENRISFTKHRAAMQRFYQVDGASVTEAQFKSIPAADIVTMSVLPDPSKPHVVTIAVTTKK